MRQPRLLEMFYQASWFSSGLCFRFRVRVRRSLGQHSDRQVRLIVLLSVNLACFRFEAARLDYQVILFPWRNTEGHLALVIGDSFPSKFLLIRSADTHSGAGKCETLFVKHGSENDKNAGVRSACSLGPGAWFKCEHRAREPDQANESNRHVHGSTAVKRREAIPEEVEERFKPLLLRLPLRHRPQIRPHPRTLPLLPLRPRHRRWH